MIVFWSIEIVSHSAEWGKRNIDEKEFQGYINGENTWKVEKAD